jgi:hypothetical protein
MRLWRCDRLYIYFICVFCLFFHTSEVQAQYSKDKFLSLVRPSDVNNEILERESHIEQLLARPLESAVMVKIPFNSEYLVKTERISKQELFKSLFPGEETYNLLAKDFQRFASLQPVKSVFQRSDDNLIDIPEKLRMIGKHASQPVYLYDEFSIYVERDKYMLTLYGSKRGGEKTILFQCSTGLGSSEFPTPKGSYYLVRIFDNKPLWIPPANRDWAYGQAPSHSVYGGHMLPFFQKKAVTNKDDDLILDLDSICPRFNLVDTETYRIHGTDSPWSIGSGQSHGCVRLLNKTVKQLSDTIKMYVGTTTRSKTENGTYINLAKPVKLFLF